MKRGAIRATVAAASLLAACSGPPVDTRAVWIDRAGEALHSYARGDLHDEPFDVAPISGEPDPRLQLGPDGRLLLLRPGPVDLGGELWDLELGRRWQLALPPLRPGADDPVRFTARGDALAWVGRSCFGGVCTPDQLWALAVGEQRRLPPGANTWPVLTGGPIDRYAKVLSASAAPVLITAAPGELSAWRYPSAATDPDTLERIDLRPVNFDPTTVSNDRCPFPDWCGTRAAVSPEGDAVFFSVDLEVCESQLVRWEPGSGSDAVPVCEGYSPELRGASLLAALSKDHLVFVDDDRMYLWNRHARPMQRAPILGSGDYFTLPADEGRALIFGAFDGPVLRADRSGVRVLSSAQTRCADPDAPVTSAMGDWVAWTCGRAPDVQLGENFASALVRVHDGELERHPGVAAWPLAIDGDGDLLFVTTDQGADDIPEDLPFPIDDGVGEFGDHGDMGDMGEEGMLEWGDAGEDWGETDAGDSGDETGGATGGPGDLNDPLGAGSIQALPPRPRTMYTLSGDGVIRRVSDMEPTPAPAKLGRAGVSAFVQVGQ